MRGLFCLVFIRQCHKDVALMMIGVARGTVETLHIQNELYACPRMQLKPD